MKRDQLSQEEFAKKMNTIEKQKPPEPVYEFKDEVMDPVFL